MIVSWEDRDVGNDGRRIFFAVHSFVLFEGFFPGNVLPIQKVRKLGGLVGWLVFKAAVGRQRSVRSEMRDSDGPAVWWVVNGDPPGKLENY